MTVLLWLPLKKSGQQQMIHVLALGIALVYIIVVTGTVGGFTEFQVDTERMLRVQPPGAFPFTMQQYRDYEADQFFYRIVIGWPDGRPVYEFPQSPDQSEFIHLQHYACTIMLAFLSMGGLFLALPIIWALNRMDHDLAEPSDVPVVVIFGVVEVFLLVLVFRMFAMGALLHLIGGLVAFTFALYPLVKVMRAELVYAESR
ncbi:MAG: hypothetical protein ACE5H4_15525 [Candidatus Thorarchaeota archaeon]